MPEAIATRLAAELPALLKEHVDDRVCWKVPVVSDPFIGSGDDEPKVLDIARDHMLDQQWDVAVSLTDVPVYRDECLIVADASVEHRVAAITLPVLGVIGLRRKARDAILRLVSLFYRDEPQPDTLIRDWPINLISPIRQVATPDEDMRDIRVDRRFVCPKVHGYLRMLAGMVLANRPWQMIFCFRTAMIAAFATAVYPLILSSLWRLSDAFGPVRLWCMTALSIAAMVVWIILAYRLWEPGGSASRPLAGFFNAATALTVTSMAVFWYAALFVLIFAASWLFVPTAYMEAALRHPAGFHEHLDLAWMTTSLAVTIGALGSGVENRDAVRHATYTHRQRRRNERREE